MTIMAEEPMNKTPIVPFLFDRSLLFYYYRIYKFRGSDELTELPNRRMLHKTTGADD
ncbi:hypothetical protein J2TS4_35590 [Paenibacillus sp. J2TS4]|nr:hypothetical protein J2TS4_35590 [Paenibacillus sp. J2TS4]